VKDYKQRIIFLVSIFLLSVSSAQADTIPATSEISNVTVFSDRALITRQVNLQLKKGEHQIVFSALPPMIEEDSISVKGEGKAGVILFGAQKIKQQLDDPQAEKVKYLQAQIESKTSERHQVENRQLVLQQKKAFLSSIQAATSEQIGKELVTKQPSVTTAMEFLAFLDRELSGVFEEKEKTDLQIREISKQIDRLRRELNDLAGGLYRVQSTVAVDIEVQKEGNFRLELSYRVPGARWEPVYEARVNGGKEEVVLQGYGLVRQNTGEDWKNVTLQLSTAKPAIGGQMPEIQTWYLRKYEPQVYNMSRQNFAAKTAMMQEPAMGGVSADVMEEMSQEAVMAQAQVNTGGPAVTYTISKAETIESNQQPKKVAIFSQTMPGTFAYEATPKLSPFAYLRAKVTNDSEQLLLAGQVQIFLDGAFVGKSLIHNIGPNEKFDLFLGIDERVKVDRKQLKGKEDESILPTLHGKTQTIDYEYVIEIENYHTSKIDLLVYDQIPISEHDEIKIERIELNPKTELSDENKPGVYVWAFNLKPKEKKEIHIQYRVKYPTKFTVIGL